MCRYFDVLDDKSNNRAMHAVRSITGSQRTWSCPYDHFASTAAQCGGATSAMNRSQTFTERFENERTNGSAASRLLAVDRFRTRLHRTHLDLHVSFYYRYLLIKIITRLSVSKWVASMCTDTYFLGTY